MRQYNGEIPDYAHVMTVDDFLEQAAGGMFIPYDGIGYWCKDGKESKDGVFYTLSEDATHVAWYNR